ncbi:NADPH-dependent 2,4-dienoyl-CoA reductase [Nocardia sputi]|uniref:NADPH-dependent 2,4-dienoyl-CoA reductase n=1 Tax=Nocardia sputi TaxID=2943705 RepID=UPI001895A5D8|nr:NADPH-dependent 2,4-dienoyl-CoA reductase [Nocardia sputi]MBF6209001.1 NADPH-dependent 2,4-dienoyl-CoA reductase [Streptomyces gardneri]
MSCTFPHLLSPIELGRVRLRNRVVMGSMHTGLEDRAWHIDRLAAFFAERARGGVGLIVTGGYSPSREGWLWPFACAMLDETDAERHRVITEAVHEAGGKIALQILHGGRDSNIPTNLAPSAVASPLTAFEPRAFTEQEIETTIADHVRCARLAQLAGYDGVEIMGGEGFLINQFLAPRTNTRTDRWGGSAANRRRFPVEVATRTRAAVGEDLLIMFRMSLAEFVEDGQTFAEIIDLAKELEAAGVDVINTDIGWHESRVPTIVTSVPRAAFVGYTAALKEHITIPVCASNRINMPEIAEDILARGDADLISLARPLLADPDWVNKAAESRVDEINTCIACNQACLDHTFTRQTVSCLVNPRACHETLLQLLPTRRAKRVAVVGAGPAGLSAAIGLAERGHQVELFEAENRIGGQFDLARRIPGKEEFDETIRYYRRKLELTGVTVHLDVRATAEQLAAGGWDEVVLATGVRPRVPDILGIDHPMVLSYPELIRKERPVGNRVAVIGAGGIGFDVSEFLTANHHTALALDQWRDEWGVTDDIHAPGQLRTRRPARAIREVTLLQRKSGPFGLTLGKTTGWIHRAALEARGVEQIGGVNYERIDDRGLHLSFGPQRLGGRVIEVDNVVVCTGQESVRDLKDQLESRGVRVHLIGGADEAKELDAKRAIQQGTQLAAEL